MHNFFYAWASFILGRKEFGMSLFIEIFLIGVGLSMDAFAVSICKGLSMKKIKKRDVFIIALFFGGFQALMPFIGWFLGKGFESYITSIDHWIAFILLGIIGGKMLIDGIKAEDDEETGEFKLDLKELFLLAIAIPVYFNMASESNLDASTIENYLAQQQNVGITELSKHLTDDDIIALEKNLSLNESNPDAVEDYLSESENLDYYINE